MALGAKALLLFFFNVKALPVPRVGRAFCFFAGKPKGPSYFKPRGASMRCRRSLLPAEPDWLPLSAVLAGWPPSGIARGPRRDSPACRSSLVVEFLAEGLSCPLNKTGLLAEGPSCPLNETGLLAGPRPRAAPRPEKDGPTQSFGNF